MNELKSEWINNEQTNDERINEWTNELINELTNEGIKEWTNKRRTKERWTNN